MQRFTGDGYHIRTAQGGRQGATTNLARARMLNRAVAEKSAVAPVAFAFGS